MGDVSVTLGPDEVAAAKLVGSRRYQTSRKAGSQQKFSGDEEQDQHAAGAEIAVCRVLGGWWEAISGKGSENAKADVRVGPDAIQVRHSKHASAFLCVYVEDDGTQPFVFVTGQLPTYKVVGSILGRDAKTPEHWTDVNPRSGAALQQPCFVVEQTELNPLIASRP